MTRAAGVNSQRPIPKQVITVFCASKAPPGSALARQAYRLGAALARAGFTICNGGYGGAMEESARGAREAGGATIGVTMDRWGKVGNRWLDRRVHTRTLTERLTRLLKLADGYAVLPGGSGTLFELAAVWEYQNKRLMPPKPIILVGNSWLPLVREARRAFHAVGQDGAAALVSVARTPESCAAFLRRALGAV